MKAQGSVLSLDELQTEGPDLLPAGEAPPFQAGSLLLFPGVVVRAQPSVYLEAAKGGDAALHDEKGVEGGREQKPAHESFDILHLKRDHKLKILLLRVKPKPRRGPQPGSRCVFLVSVYMELNRKAIHYIMASDEKGGTVP